MKGAVLEYGTGRARRSRLHIPLICLKCEGRFKLWDRVLNRLCERCRQAHDRIERD